MKSIRFVHNRFDTTIVGIPPMEDFYIGGAASPSSDELQMSLAPLIKMDEAVAKVKKQENISPCSFARLSRLYQLLSRMRKMRPPEWRPHLELDDLAFVRYGEM